MGPIWCIIHVIPSFLLSSAHFITHGSHLPSNLVYQPRSPLFSGIWQLFSLFVPDYLFSLPSSLLCFFLVSSLGLLSWSCWWFFFFMLSYAWLVFIQNNRPSNLCRAFLSFSILPASFLAAFLAALTFLFMWRLSLCGVATRSFQSLANDPADIFGHLS